MLREDCEETDPSGNVIAGRRLLPRLWLFGSGLCRSVRGTVVPARIAPGDVDGHADATANHAVFRIDLMFGQLSLPLFRFASLTRKPKQE
jgi:hypothetical protein